MNKLQISRLLAVLDGGADGVQRAFGSGVLHELLPDPWPRLYRIPGGPHHLYNPQQHCVLCARLMARPERWARLAALVHDIGKFDTLTYDLAGVPHFYRHEIVGSSIMARAMVPEEALWRYHGVEPERVAAAVRYHMVNMGTVRPRRIALWVATYGIDFVEVLTELRFADWSAGRPDGTRLPEAVAGRTRMLAMLAEHQERAAARRAGKAPTVLDLAISGRDLLDVGFKSGPQIGKLLRDAQFAVNAGMYRNDREELLAEIRRIYGSTR